MSSLKAPKEVPKVTDAEWAGSDRPTLACADGCVRIVDLKLRQGCSPVEEHQITGLKYRKSTFIITLNMTIYTYRFKHGCISYMLFCVPPRFADKHNNLCSCVQTK